MNQKYLKNLPRVIMAKFPSKCAETNKAIKKGEEVLYMPSEKKVYSLSSNYAKEYFRTLESDNFDQRQLDGQYY